MITEQFSNDKVLLKIKIIERIIISALLTVSNVKLKVKNFFIANCVNYYVCIVFIIFNVLGKLKLHSTNLIYSDFNVRTIIQIL